MEGERALQKLAEWSCEGVKRLKKGDECAGNRTNGVDEEMNGEVLLCYNSRRSI